MSAKALEVARLEVADLTVELFLVLIVNLPVGLVSYDTGTGVIAILTLVKQSAFVLEINVRSTIGLSFK